MKTKLVSLAVSLAIVSAVPVNAQTQLDLTCNQCVDTSDVAEFAIGTGQLMPASIDEKRLQEGAVSTGKLQNGAVVTSKLKQGSVSTGKLQNQAVTTSKLAPNAVATNRIIDDAVTKDKLSPVVRSLLDEVTQLRAEMDALTQSGSLPVLAARDITFDTGTETLTFEGINVQIVNGLGDTNTINGTGNLIVGYNEVDDPFGNQSEVICSDGDFDTENDCLAAGGVWDSSQKTGSHNLVVGRAHAYTQYGGTVLGLRNAINGAFSNVTGGFKAIASGSSATVSGGSSNVASGSVASVTGGTINKATGTFASVTGGHMNTASDYYSTVSGGESRVADDYTEWCAGSLCEPH